MTAMPRLRLGLALSLLAGAACQRATPPDVAFRAFVKAAGDRDSDGAWAMLSHQTQASFTDFAKAAAAKAPGVVTSDPKLMLFGDAMQQVHQVKSVAILKEEAERAVLKVEDEGGRADEVTMVKEAGKWKVEIPIPPPGS